MKLWITHVLAVLVSAMAVWSLNLPPRQPPARPRFRFPSNHSSNCFKPVRITALQYAASEMAKSKNVPGAGMNQKALEPYGQVFKDNFMLTSCVKDQMFLEGDAFGDHKSGYTLDDVSNVSIVHYAALVPKEDREAMTPSVCFNFCRTLKDMNFFGLMNGRECYCTPYYTAQAGDSSSCDSVCDGDPTQMCGGKSKSSIYEMHSCNDGAVDLGVNMVLAYTQLALIEELVPLATAAAQGKQQLAETMQAHFGKTGDPAASDLMQSGKVTAGELLHAAKAAGEFVIKMKPPIDVAVALTGLAAMDVEKLSKLRSTNPDDELPGLVEQAIANSGVQTADFNSFDVQKKADDAIALMKKQAAHAKQAFKNLNVLYLRQEPEVNDIFFVKEGNCAITDDGCVVNRKTNGEYMNTDSCVIELPEKGADVSFESFNVDPLYDTLTVNGIQYTSTLDYPTYAKTYMLQDWKAKDPENLENAVELQQGWDAYYAADGWSSAEVTQEGAAPTLAKVTHASGEIQWHTDSVVTHPGWKICGAKAAAPKNDEGKLYYPLMYFADKRFVNMPTTCSGVVVGTPIYYKSIHSCAAMCNTAVSDCVGFAYYPDTTVPNNNGPNMCFLFSKFHSAMYYTGCESEGAFLQKLNTTAGLAQPILEEPKGPICGLKLSKFVNTDITPDPSGKCDGCLKTLTKADRCYK